MFRVLLGLKLTANGELLHDLSMPRSNISEAPQKVAIAVNMPVILSGKCTKHEVKPQQLLEELSNTNACG